MINYHDLIVERKKLSDAGKAFVDNEYAAHKELQVRNEDADKISTLVDHAVRKYSKLLFEDPKAAMEDFKENLPSHLQATVSLSDFVKIGTH